MKSMTKKTLAEKLDNKDFHEPLRDDLIAAANANNLVIVFSEDLDFFRFEGAVCDYVYAHDRPFLLGRYGLVSPSIGVKQPVVEIDAWRFGNLNGEEMHPGLYAKLGKPAWDFECGALGGKCATFNIKERQDFGEGVDYFCRGVVLDLDELFPVEGTPHA